MLAMLLTQPLLTLVIEVVLACLLAVVIGYIVGKGKGALAVFSATLSLDVLLLIVVTVLFRQRLPFQHLALTAGQFSPDTATHLANTYLVVEVGIWTVMLAAAVGHYFSKEQGTGFLAFFAWLATLLSAIAAAIPFYPFGFRNTSWLLAIAIAVIGVGLAWLFSAVVLENKKFIVPSILWFEYVLACWIGYQVAGRIGFLLVTLPSQALFAAMLYFLANYILPLENKEQHKQALRSLVTFNLGTNYPYYVIEDWRNEETFGQKQPDPRVPGNPFGEFFSGPGIVLNSCDHASVTGTGSDFIVHPPGLSFTDIFELMYTDVDLRPQHRGMTIEAETKDGIPVTIFTFMPHRIPTGGQAIELGESYPYDEEGLVRAVGENATVEHDWRREDGRAIEDVREIPWHELVYLKGPAILKDIISHYTCDELHAPGDPRVEIAGEFSRRIKEEMAPLGIEMVGGGVSNIIVPERVVSQRIKNWEAEWEKKIAIEVGKAEAEVTRQIESIQNEVQQEILAELASILVKAKRDHIREDLLMRQLIEAMNMEVPKEQKTTSSTLLELLLRRSAIELIP